jgi:hypothetical protein
MTIRAWSDELQPDVCTEACSRDSGPLKALEHLRVQDERINNSSIPRQAPTNGHAKPQVPLNTNLARRPSFRLPFVRGEGALRLLFHPFTKVPPVETSRQWSASSLALISDPVRLKLALPTL